MEQQLDAFTQRRFELMVEMATKKLQQEISAVKEQMAALHGELGSLKSQLSRAQFQQPQQYSRQSSENVQADESQVKKEVKIVDCRPDGEKTKEFVSGAARNSEPIRPRYGDYEPKDVSIDKFFYFGRK